MMVVNVLSFSRRWRPPCDVSILSPPRGGLQPGLRACRGRVLRRFNPQPPARGAATSPFQLVHHNGVITVSILSPPRGGLQHDSAKSLLDYHQFQSSAPRAGGCNRLPAALTA